MMVMVKKRFLLLLQQHYISHVCEPSGKALPIMSHLDILLLESIYSAQGSCVKDDSARYLDKEQYDQY